MHSSFGVFGSLFFPSVVPFSYLASCFQVHNILEVHATGSTVRLASKVTELLNRLVDEDGHYVNIIQ